MGCLCVCNTNSDTISIVNTENLSLKKTINLRNKENTKVGPHGIIYYKNSIFVVNNYSNNLKIIENFDECNVENHYIGIHCNDLVIYDEKVYVACGESNSVVVFDMLTKKIIEEIPCENQPHSIEINDNKKLMVVSNFNSNSITLIDLEDSRRIYNIRVGEYPTKACFTHLGDKIIVCESNIGNHENGSIRVLSLKELKNEINIKVGKIPVDVFLTDKFSFVSNFGDGSIDIIDLGKYIKKRSIYVGGMPRGIIVDKGKLFIGDNYNNILIKLDINGKIIKSIPIGKEPTGIAYFTHQLIL
ncbi:YncE family protein [Clostridium sediminicola]|uniref:YncE family protein n=1 Tax=Clostridium sediminicola TaxID=3114879 RepID=UPI0031F20E48